MKEISVIIPTYNCEKYIRDAIDSVLKQSVSPLELIIVDDGSSDTTKNAVAEYDDPRIIYVFQENRGVSAARNLGMARARGEFIAFLDADDRWRPKMLEMQLEALSLNKDVVFCFTNFVRFDNYSGKFLAEQFSFYMEIGHILTQPLGVSSCRTFSGDSFSALVSFGEVPGFTQCIMFRKLAIDGILFNETLRICEDMDFVLRAATRGMVAFNSTVLAEVRRHDANATKDISGIAIDKINALLSIKKAITLTGDQERAINHRIVRAYLIASTSEIQAGNLKAGISYYLKSFLTQGGISKKLKGFFRLIFEIVTRRA